MTFRIRHIASDGVEAAFGALHFPFGPERFAITRNDACFKKDDLALMRLGKNAVFICALIQDAAKDCVYMRAVFGMDQVNEANRFKLLRGIAKITLNRMVNVTHAAIGLNNRHQLM